MLRIRCVTFIAGLLTITGVAAFAKDAAWPLKGEIDLSNGFGDYRDGRFHTGLDLRTGGVEGRPVYSPVDGFVWRIKTSYYGYGKALYVKGRDGYVYVYGHLSAYAPALDTTVRRAQIAAENYALDLYPPADSIPVRQGALIAYSGQTGAGAPHLHFEKRLTDEFPLNPLRHGFSLPDKIRPTLERVGFQLTDDHSLLGNGKRQQFLPVKPGKRAGQYFLDTVLYFNSPFGFLVDGFDRVRLEGMKQSISLLRLAIDDRPVYESRFDTLSFATGKSVWFEYDYGEATNGEKQVRRLFHLTGNEFAGSRATDSSGGIVRTPFQKFGRHSAVITAEDGSGNRAELTVPFVFGPPTPLATLDSSTQVALSTKRFYFTRSVYCDSLSVDSTAALFCVRSDWVFTPSAIVHKISKRSFYVDVEAGSLDVAVLRLVHRTAGGGWAADPPFNGLVLRTPKGLQITYEILDDGLLVDLRSGDNFGCDLRLDLFGGGKLLKRIKPPDFYSTTAYHFFVPPQSELRQIDSIGVSATADTAVRGMETIRCAVRAVGFAPVDTMAIDALFAVTVASNDLYGPRFISLDKLVLPTRSMYRMNSDAYRIRPDNFPMRGNLSLHLFMNVPNDKSYLTGLCRFDFKKNQWQWRPDSKFGSDTLVATAQSGGVFASIFDTQAPSIEYLSLQPHQTVTDPRPFIQFELKDTLSGVVDDRGIDVRIDRQWQIPEWDPETGICTVRPLDPLATGEHQLAIKVKDRAGNLAQEYRIFTVKKPGSPNK